MADGCGETGALPRDLARGGPAVCAGDGGKGEIPNPDADAGEFHRLPGNFLLLITTSQTF
jgi:hypothetical protein